MVVDPMANAMKKPAKKPTLTASKAKSAAVKSTKPVEKKVVAAKSAGQAKAVAAKTKAATSSSKAATKSAAVAAKTPAAKLSPKVAAKPVSVQSKAPVTNKKSEVKSASKSAKVEPKVESRPGVNVMITATVSQTTDAATLAAIDTSGYILPTVKVPGRRGRKPVSYTHLTLPTKRIV